MAAKTLTAIRLPDEMLARIDAFAERLQREQPGLDVNRAVAIRILIARSLQASETGKRRKR